MDVELKKGILRIAAGGSRGTGVVVRRSSDAIEILTAFHVVGDLDASREQGQPRWLAATATLSPQSGAELTASLPGSPCDLDDDWVLLRVEGTPPDDTPALPLAALSPRTYQPDWSSFGYTDAEPDTGEPHSGQVELVESDVIHLYGKQAAAGKGGRVSGLSGGPCIVEGQVVGLVLDALQQGTQRESVHGALYALPIQKVAAACGLPFESTAALPFQGEIEQAISGLGGTFLREVAEKVGVVSALSEPALRRAVARALLGADATTSREVLVKCRRHLKGVEPMALAEMLLAMEIREETARLIERTGAGAAPRGVGAVAGTELTAKLLALRALHAVGYENALLRFQYVDSPSRTPEDWAERIRSGLYAMMKLEPGELGPDEDGEALSAELVELGMSVLAVPFDEQVLPELEKYEAVRPLVLVPSSASLRRDGYEVAPPYRSKSEKEIETAYSRYDRALKR